MVIVIWLLVGFHLATGSVQITLADNARECVRQLLYRENKKGLCADVPLFVSIHSSIHQPNSNIKR